MKRWKAAGLVGAGVFTIGLLVFGLPTWLRWQDEKALDQSAVAAEGTIVRLIPHNHNTCKYAYDADGKPYTGIGASCGDARIGDKIDIWYARTDPENSANEEPGSWRFPVVWLAWILVVMPAFAAFGILYSRRPMRNDQPPEN